MIFTGFEKKKRVRIKLNKACKTDLNLMHEDGDQQSQSQKIEGLGRLRPG
jgi:hypothetical protein